MQAAMDVYIGAKMAFSYASLVCAKKNDLSCGQVQRQNSYSAAGRVSTLSAELRRWSELH
eukprot:5571559-Pleurochrysis_carterae.AAC.4